MSDQGTIRVEYTLSEALQVAHSLEAMLKFWWKEHRSHCPQIRRYARAEARTNARLIRKLNTPHNGLWSRIK